MPRESEPSLNERAFLLEALQEDTRLDGRDLDAFRDVQIIFGEEYGVADVKLGKTRALARISASIATPNPDRKFDGIFTITTELSPMAAPSFEAGRQTDLEAHLSLLLDRSIRRSSALSTESLCLVAGSKVWSLACTIHILDHDGNLLSAACIAAVAALSHFRIPDTSIHGGELTVYSTKERNPIPLALLHWPFCVSFAVFEGGEKIIVDAVLVEEQCSEGEVVVTANKSGEVCAISKQGGVPTDALVLLGCVDTAVEKVRMLNSIVSKALDIDATKRDVGGLMAELSAENAR